MSSYLKKIGSFLAVITITLTLVIPNGVQANQKYEHKNVDCTQNIELTKKEKQHLNKLFHKLYEDKVKIYEALEKYGVLSKQQKENHIQLMKQQMKEAKKAKNNWCKEKSKD